MVNVQATIRYFVVASFMWSFSCCTRTLQNSLFTWFLFWRSRPRLTKETLVCSLLLRIVCINRGGGDGFTGFREGDREAGRDARPWRPRPAVSDGRSDAAHSRRGDKNEKEKRNKLPLVSRHKLYRILPLQSTTNTKIDFSLNNIFWWNRGEEKKCRERLKKVFIESSGGIQISQEGVSTHPRRGDHFYLYFYDMYYMSVLPGGCNDLLAFICKPGSFRFFVSMVSSYNPWATAAVVLELLEVAGRAVGSGGTETS